MTRIKIGNIDIEVIFKTIKNLHLNVHRRWQGDHASPDFYDPEKVKIYAVTALSFHEDEKNIFCRPLRNLCDRFWVFWMLLHETE